MSDKGEHESLLAHSDDSLDFGMDQHIAMQQMMGFGSFGSPLKPKRQPRGPGMGRGFGTGANTEPVQHRNPSNTAIKSSKLSPLSLPFVPASLPPRPPRPQKQGSKTPPPTTDGPSYQNLDTIVATPSPKGKNMGSTSFITTSPTVPASEPTLPSMDAHNADPSQDNIAYTHPVTGFKLTKRELNAYERGVVEDVVNNDGVLTKVKVFFKPNFIEDNPWEDLEIRAGLRKPKTTSNTMSEG